MSIAVYIRVSTVGQNEAGQRSEIQKWLKGNGISGVRWFVDKESGDNLARPEFEKMQAAIFSGEIRTVVCWKLDRLSRKLRDGINTLCDWCDRGMRVVSVTQQIDFTGTVGKMIASVLFAVAEMEQDARRERQAAGISAAKASGKRWGGSEKGRWIKVTEAQLDIVDRMKKFGKPITEIASATGLSRPTIYRILNSAK